MHPLWAGRLADGGGQEEHPPHIRGVGRVMSANLLGWSGICPLYRTYRSSPVWLLYSRLLAICRCHVIILALRYSALRLALVAEGDYCTR